MRTFDTVPVSTSAAAPMFDVTEPPHRAPMTTGTVQKAPTFFSSAGWSSPRQRVLTRTVAFDPAASASATAALMNGSGSPSAGTPTTATCIPLRSNICRDAGGVRGVTVTVSGASPAAASRTSSVARTIVRSTRGLRGPCSLSLGGGFFAHPAHVSPKARAHAEIARFGPCKFDYPTTAMRRVLVGAAFAIGIATLGVIYALPAVFLGSGAGSAPFYAFEVGFGLLAVVASARTKAAHVVRRIVVAIYATFLLFLAYEHGFKSFFRREPALVEDWRFAINLVHFLSEMRTWRWHALIWGSIAAAVLGVWGLGRFLAALQRRTRSLPTRRVAAVALAWAILGGASHLLDGPIRSVGGAVVANVRASSAARERLGPLRDAGRDGRYDSFMDVRLARRPSFYFLVIEAYGQILVTWDMTAAYRDLMGRVQTRLEAAGYRMRTAYSSAPVHGGRSWLSTSTMQTGILIDQPVSYAAFETASHRIPTLVGFFRAQGYHTASIEPGTKERTGLGHDDAYGHEVRVDAPRLEYDGPRYGFGGIPDRHSLDMLRTRFLPRLAEPRYVFYMAVSTHFPWSRESVPPFEGGPEWPPLADTAAITSELRLWYLRSVEYEWRVLLELLEAERSQDVVIVVLGDHQPRLESNQPGEATFDTPVHVISRDAAFVERFGERGFQPGLYAEPGRAAPLVHEALFSLLTTELAGAYGTPETKGLARFYPTGITVGGLNP